MYQLRELEKRDLPEINKWRNDPELISHLGAPFRYINLDVDEQWFNGYMGKRNTQVRCVITEQGKNDILGLISLVSIDYMNGTAEMHLMIGDKNNRGKGIGTFAVGEMLNHTFNNMNLRRIELTVLEDNIPAIKLYEKMGFVREGVKRQAKYKNGTYVNMALYAVLRSEFKNK